MPEQQNVEWKESWRDEYMKWISGFANAKGGSIFIGKADDGSITGVLNYKKLMEDLPNKISSKLGVLCDINLHKEGSLHYIEILTRPYNIAISYNGKYYRRSGSTNQELRGSDLNEFLLKQSGRTWDAVVEPNATLDDIDKDSLKTFVEEAVKNGRLSAIESETDIKSILENLRLMEDVKLKRAALLLFGKDPKKYFVSAFIKIGMFGESDTELKFQEVLEGNLVSLATDAFMALSTKFLKKNISYEGIKRLEILEYPSDAIREALFNAMVHRVYEAAPIQISVYDDRIVFWNQGTLPEQLTIQDLKAKHSSFPRNPLIADVFFKAGFIESWGRGTLKIIDECSKAGLPEPKIEEITGGILVTLFKDKTNEDYLKRLDVSDNQKEAIRYLKNNFSITNSKYQELFEVSDRTALRHLDELTKLGILKKVGEKKGTIYTLY